jgi:excisionase family DNA binding protein
MAISAEDSIRIFTLEEVGAFLKLSVRTVYTMVSTGKIPGRKIGRQWRFDREKILKWVNAGQAENSREQEAQGPGQSVLVVEDNPVLLEAYISALCDAFPGFDVKGASDGLGALVEIGRSEPCAVVLDITIPRVDGLDICRILKRDPDLSRICVVAITGTPEENLEKEAIDAGADLFLRKPFGAVFLAEQVRMLVGRSIAKQRPAGAGVRRRQAKKTNAASG